MKEFTRQQRAVLNFEQSTDRVRSSILDLCGQLPASAFDEVVDGISSFMLSELNFRQSERCSALALRKELGVDAVRQAEQFHKKGLAIFESARVSLENHVVATKTSDIRPDRNFSVAMSRLLLEARNEVVELELKASDAKELDGVLNAVFSILMSAENESTLQNYVLTQIIKMNEVRSSAGRGALTNIAVWKLVAAAVLLGFGSWLVYKCYYSKWKCTKSEKAVYNSILSVALIVFGACD